MSSELKVMSFNMRTQVKGDGENQFLCRKEFIGDFLNTVKPDVIGCQEMTPLMREWMVETMTDYYIVGGYRGKNYDSECVCVAFKKDKFALYDCETFWLSAEPYTPGSRYTGDQSTCPRVCTWVTLKPNGDAKPFRFYNVHTDHVGHVARVLASNQVLQKIGENNGRAKMKTFITGDFNALPDDLCITTMLNYQGTPLVDLSEKSGQTFHSFGRIDDPNYKIDYIFADADTTLVDFKKFEDRRGELYLSDHTPIMATVVID